MASFFLPRTTDAETPFVVVPDAQPITGAPSQWANPFSAVPHDVTWFDAT